MDTVHIFTDGDCLVILEQRTNKKFRVTYGGCVYDQLSYADAYKEFGSCVFHSLACAGKLDNQEEEDD